MEPVATAAATAELYFTPYRVSTITCNAPTPQNGKIIGNGAYRSFRGISIFKGFSVSSTRPNIQLIQGVFDITTTPQITHDSVRQLAYNVIKYDITSNASTTIDDAKIELEKQQLELKVQKEMLDPQQKQMQFEKEMSLREIELAQKAKNEDEKSNISQSKELINALDKIQNLSQRGI